MHPSACLDQPVVACSSVAAAAAAAVVVVVAVAVAVAVAVDVVAVVAGIESTFVVERH